MERNRPTRRTPRVSPIDAPGGAAEPFEAGTLPPRIESPARGLAPAPRDGRYAGAGRLVGNPGLRNPCRATVPINDFIVSGSDVRFRGARGTIGPHRDLDLQMGGRFITGRFSGSRFEGRFWQPPPACTYLLVLDPVS